MIRLLRCHFNYLLNRAILLVFFIVLLLTLGGDLYAALSCKALTSFRENNLYYFQNVFFIVGFLSNFAAVFVFIHSFLSKNDQYVALLLTRGSSRLTYFLSKLLLLFLFLFVFLYLLFCLFLLSGFLFVRGFALRREYLSAYFSLYLQNLYLGLFGLLVGQILKNIYAVIIPFFLYNLGSMINEENSRAGELYNFFIPGFRADTPELFLGVWHILLMAIILSVANLLIYLEKDLNCE